MSSEAHGFRGFRCVFAPSVTSFRTREEEKRAKISPVICVSVDKRARGCVYVYCCLGFPSRVLVVTGCCFVCVIYYVVVAATARRGGKRDAEKFPASLEKGPEVGVLLCALSLLSREGSERRGGEEGSEEPSPSLQGKEYRRQQLLYTRNDDPLTCPARATSGSTAGRLSLASSFRK